MRKFVLVFFDEILIYSHDVEQHIERLRQVLRTFKQHQLYINGKKCNFRKPEFEYLGHIISGSSVAANPKKVAAMVEWPIPKDVKSLKGFLGLIGYYRRFVRNYGEMAIPLTQLLTKDSFKWEKEAQVAFEQLKTAMISLPIFAVPVLIRHSSLSLTPLEEGWEQFLCKKGDPLLI